MNATDLSSVRDTQLLLQLGERLKRLRKSQKIGAVELAQRAGISRTTLNAIESGDPGPSMGNYLRVMSALGVGADLALLVADVLQPSTPGSAAAHSRRTQPTVTVQVRTDTARHQAQDLQSLALHQAAVELARTQPEWLSAAQALLERWLASGNNHSASLWHEWQGILAQRQWRKITARTRRAQELRQASPLTPLLPQELRERILAQVRELRQGVVLGNTVESSDDASEGSGTHHSRKR